MDYSTLRLLLSFVFSVDVGLSEESRKMATENYLRNPDIRQRLRNELIAFEESGESWVELLECDYYCVFKADSEKDARDFIMEKFGARLLICAGCSR